MENCYGMEYHGIWGSYQSANSHLTCTNANKQGNSKFNNFQLHVFKLGMNFEIYVSCFLHNFILDWNVIYNWSGDKKCWGGGKYEQWFLYLWIIYLLFPRNIISLKSVVFKFSLNLIFNFFKRALLNVKVTNAWFSKANIFYEFKILFSWTQNTVINLN